MSKPVWIVFEGLDGSGKTTQAKLLNDYLNSIGVKSLYKHVFDSKAGKLLREVFIDNAMSNTVEILILCAARQAFLDDVQEGGYDALIVDRFFLSILAMQGVDDSDVELIGFVQDNICHGRDKPVVFHLNTSPEDCDKRLENKHIRDRIERKGTAFHATVFERYAKLLNGEENVYQFDGSRDIAAIHQSIIDQARAVLGITDDHIDAVAGSRTVPQARRLDDAR